STHARSQLTPCPSLVALLQPPSQPALQLAPAWGSGDGGGFHAAAHGRHLRPRSGAVGGGDVPAADAGGRGQGGRVAPPGGRRGRDREPSRVTSLVKPRP